MVPAAACVAVSVAVLAAALAVQALADGPERQVPPSRASFLRPVQVGDGTGPIPSVNDPAAVVDSLLGDPLLPVRERISGLETLLREYEAPAEPWAYRAAHALGQIYLGAGRQKLAIPYLEFALEGLPDDPELLNTLGYVYAEEDMLLDEAIDLVRRALQVAPEETSREVLGFYHDSLGWAHLKRGDLDSARVHLEAAVELAPETPEITEHLIELYERQDRVEAASALLVDALVATRGTDRELRARLRRLHRTTPEGRPIEAERLVARRVRELEQREIEADEAAGGRVLRLESSDGFVLRATRYRARDEARATDEKGRPGVLLVHGPGSDRTVYRQLGARLAAAGIDALALDVRGHGGSRSAELPHERAFAEDYGRNFEGALRDVAAALDVLRRDDGIDDQRLGLVAEGVGGLWAMLGGLEFGGVRGIVLLSPAWHEQIDRLLERRSGWQGLFVAAQHDTVSLAAARKLLEQVAPEGSEVKRVAGDASGAALLETSSDLDAEVVRWLGALLLPSRRL
jgi:pimeloyl-ACP methyl ester carboxylesterase/Flp pilus assembly protein TadD